MDTLKIARMRKKLKQSQLAEICGITPVTISLIESGHTVPHQSTRNKIEKILDEIDWDGTFEDGVHINSNGKQHTKNEA